MLIRYLPAQSAFVTALNDGRPQWSVTDRLIADLWALWAKKDHPARAEMAEKARIAERSARIIKLRALYEKKKRAYGIGVE